MEEIVIKQATLDDVALLQQIGRQTFFETFAPHNSEVNMTKYLQERFALDRLTAELANPLSEFYCAWLNGRVIGYLKLNSGTAQTESQGDDAMEIERIYVLHEFHGKKVGQLLYEKVMEAAHAKQVHYVWLGVWEENVRAKRFYEKNGFVQFDTHIFRLGDDEQTDLLMKKTL
jgi:ribosomal protein S18 acetylase RimI-like enzyme